MTSKLRTFAPRIHPARTQHTASVLFCHGFGSVANDFDGLADIKALDYCKFILPQAPLRALSLQGGAPGTAFYDIIRSNHTERTQDGTEDEVGMQESLADIRKYIRAERELGIPSERIILGGFSQGAALAVLAGLTGEDRVGGIAVLSGYMPLQWKLLEMKSRWANDVPMFVAHGTEDPVIKFKVGKGAADKYRESGVESVQFQAYEGMEHSTCSEEMDDLTAWLLKAIPPLPPGQTPKM